MKSNLKLIPFLAFACILLMVPSTPAFADLIEPSRTLTGKQKPMGRLSVFSEPPALNVFLDGVEIGKTPVISKKVAAGDHNIAGSK